MAKAGRKKSQEEIKLYSFKLPTALMNEVAKNSKKYQKTKNIIQAIKEWLEKKK